MMTTPIDLSQTDLLILGDREFKFTPTLAVVRLSGELYDGMDAMREPQISEDGIDHVKRMYRKLSDVYRLGTARHADWEDVREYMDNFTFGELVHALDVMVQSRADEPDFTAETEEPGP